MEYCTKYVRSLKERIEELEARLDTTSDKLSAAYMDKCAENYQLEDQIDQLRTENRQLQAALHEIGWGIGRDDAERIDIAREAYTQRKFGVCPDCCGSGNAFKGEDDIPCSKCGGDGELRDDGPGVGK